MYAIYSTWVKRSFENICYSTIHLNNIIKEYIMFYCNTFSLMYEAICEKKQYSKFIKKEFVNLFSQIYVTSELLIYLIFKS